MGFSNENIYTKMDRKKSKKTLYRSPKEKSSKREILENKVIYFLFLLI